MKKFRYTIIRITFLFTLFLVGCEEYLDQSPDANVKEEDVYKNFKNFQGFVEGIQTMILAPSAGHVTLPNLADEGYMLPSSWISILKQFDAGNYWAWQSAAGTFFGRFLNINTNPDTKADKGGWPAAWYGIYNANLGLSKLEDGLIGATDAEKNVIKGQLLFLRGYFYFDLLQYWGGMPYIEEPLSSSDLDYFPRLSAQETAIRAAQDLGEAAALLPVDWDDEPYGALTQGNNQKRITKFAALAMQGKSLLFAGSPLLNKEASGNAGFNTDLCKESAQVFKSLIDLCQSTGKFKLQDWDSYNDIFTSIGTYKTNGGTEALFMSSVFKIAVVRSYFFYLFRPASNPYGGESHLSLNYEYSKNFGMKNGLPITESDSGYDPSDPWSNRDERFNKFVLVDGQKITETQPANAVDQYAQFYNGGAHRDKTNLTNWTGIDIHKFWTEKCNYKDTPNIDHTFIFCPPIVRLTDVYLMYAEALLWGYGTPQSTIPGDSKPMSAVEAVNLIRNRATVPDMDARFTADCDKFFEQLVVERAVELFMEGQRWTDLRRWLRNDDPRYLKKTAVDFDRGPDGKPINIRERLLVTRDVSDRHNWLPLPVNSSTIYPEFGQNPGW